MEAESVASTQPTTKPTQQETIPQSSPFANSKLFNQTLSKLTSRYIQSKMMLSPKESEDLKKIDLRHMCDNVVNELQVVQKEAAYDYIKVSSELKSLSEEIGKSDQIMQELQGVLYSFRDHLQSIKSEMTSLQERSLKMNTSLTNRKKLQKMLLTFVESAVLDKQLIDAICLAPINEEYVEHIRALLQKLNYLKNTSISSDSKAVKQLQPELEKLKTKASARLRQFLLEKIQMLTKPKTHVQVMQKEVLAKFKVFTQFLRDHFPPIYTEVCNAYRETLSKIYLKNYKAFLFQIEKCQVELYTKTDTLIPQDAGSMRTFLSQTKHTSLNQQKKSIFSLMGREKVLDAEEDPITFNLAHQQSQKFTMEHIFKYINRMLVEGVVFQVVFTADFFNLKSEEANAIFGAIFKPSINVFLQFLKTTTDNSFDLMGVMLLIVLNERNKKQFSERSLTTLQFYFNQINMLLWPKFENLFDFHKRNIETPNLATFKQIQKAVTIKVLLQRYVDFMAAMYKMYSYFAQSNMVDTRISSLRKKFLQLIKEAAKEHPREFDNLVYCLNCIEFIYNGLSQLEISQNKKEFEEDLANLEKDIAQSVEKISNLYMKQLFSGLYDFVKKYFKEGELNTDNYQQAKQASLAITAVIDAKLLQAIVTDLSQNLNKKIEGLKTQCEARFTVPGGFVLKSIIKKFVTIFMNYYNAFYKYTKSAQPALASGMLPMHSLMKELKNHTKKYNI